MIIFSGTAYLALDRHPQMHAWVTKGLSRYGLHYGGSRRSSLAPDMEPEMPRSSRSRQDERRKVLKSLLRRRRARTQEGLVEALREKGFEITQSSLSRDLMHLGAHKVDGAYRLGGEDDELDEDDDDLDDDNEFDDEEE